MNNQPNVELRLAYFYAEIDPVDNMCVGILRTSVSPENGNNPNMIPIPVYDEEYVMKYYINGEWYEDAEGTIPWTSSLL